MAAMYLRFAVSRRDPQSHTWIGLFNAAYQLQDSGRLGSAEATRIQEMLDWFKENLPTARPGRKWHPRAVCWFRTEAGEPLKKGWELARFLEAQGVWVRLYKTRDPGRRIYSDRFQVMAVPQVEPRTRLAW
jgi:hypothetical protein